MALHGMEIINQFSDFDNLTIEVLLEACEMLHTHEETREDGLTPEQLQRLIHIKKQLNTLYWYRVVPDEQAQE